MMSNLQPESYELGELGMDFEDLLGFEELIPQPGLCVPHGK